MRIPILIIIILFACMDTVLGQTGILNRTVKIEYSEGTVGSLLKEISNKGGFIFSYNQDIPYNERVKLKYKRQTVQEFLDELFIGEIYCIEYENKLLIKTKPRIPECYTVTGRVVESGSGEPVPGATVIIPGSDPLIGAVSDEEGLFHINVPSALDAIRFSSIGHESRSFDSPHLIPDEVGLSPVKHEISEVVIEHVSLPQHEESTVSISYLSAHKLESTFGSSIEHALQGNASGVFVVRNSGMPGSSFQVKIRGNHSLINSDPVYYLDGIPVQQTIVHAISPNDIASIEVLKDPTSTAIYGASAGNGVVLLHSKKGDPKKTRVTFNYNIGMQQAWKKLDLMDSAQFLNYYKLVRPLDSKYSNLDNAFSSDWQDIVFHAAKTENCHLSVSGGNDRSNYYLGSGFFNQASIINELEFRRYSIKFRADHRVSRKWTMGHDLSLAYAKYDGLKEGCFLNDHNNPIAASLCMLPISPPDASFMDASMVRGLPEDNRKLISQTIPYLDSVLTNNRRNNYMAIGNLYSEVAISRQLSYVSRFGFEVYYQNNRSSSRPLQVYFPISNLSILEDNYQVLDLGFHWQNFLRYHQEFAVDHKIDGSVGIEYGQNENQWIPVKHLESNPIQYSPNTASSNQAYLDLRSSTSFRHNAFFCSLNYVFRDRYILNGSIRREVVEFDTVPGVKKQYSDIYPSLSAGWIFINRSHPVKSGTIQYGKIRYAYGMAGNSPRLDYSFHAKTMRDMAYIYSFSSSGSFTNSADQRQTNELFYWEKISAHNLGIELGMFQNRLFLSTDLFRNHLHVGETSGYDDPLPFTGKLYSRDLYGIIQLPLADIVNSGIEGEISYKKAGHLLNWDLSFHVTHLRNRIRKVMESSALDINGGTTDPLSVNLPGETAGSFYGYKIDRLFCEADCPAPGQVATNQPYTIDQDGNRIYAQPEARAGDYKFVDINNDAVIDQNDKTIIGNPYPDLTYGFYANAQYRQFDMSMLWQGTYGNEIYNATRLWLYNPYGTANWTTDMENSYRSPQFGESGEVIDEGLTDTDLHRVDYNNDNKNLRVSDFYVEDGSYLRLKNIQLGYTLNPVITRRIHVEKFRIFIAAQNLLTFTNYSGLDPEVGGWGIDSGIYPQPRTYYAGVNIEF
jgi:TonB-linked SusC/RagA family outer membrane protein